MRIVHQGAIAIGDAFIDYLSINENNDNYEKRLGGASVNLAVHLSRFGIPSFYVTKLGNEQDSQFVQEQLAKENIKLDYSVLSKGKLLPSVYIHLDQNGDRHFHSYENKTPDDVLSVDDIKEEAFLNKLLFYFGSGTLFHEAAKEATVKAIMTAKNHGAYISFDANIRLKRWESEEHCRSTILSLLPIADIVKFSEEELLFLLEEESLDAALSRVKEMNIPLLFVTAGKAGSYAVFQGQVQHVKSKTVQAVDTTGAGDAFMGAVLYSICTDGFPANIQKAADYACNGNIMGALIAKEPGALPNIGGYSNIAEKFFTNPHKNQLF
ncbi:PfkB family carbohydrate kinase [Niallia taxi]|uniref:carbohydrate kinase family protein n=1 Tax=Niallia taxi TaxID=2499688 RepID=UPI00398278B5